MMLINTGVVPFIKPARLDDMVSSDVEDINVSEIQEAVLDSIRESFNGK